MGHGYNEEICGKFLFFRFAEDFVVNDEGGEEIDFETLHIENLMKVRLMRKMKKLLQ